MAFVPNISNYKPFYIQPAGAEGATETSSAFGMVAKTNPYPLLPSPKEPYNNDWKDEDGDDEYTDEIYYKGFEFTVSFYVKTFGSNDISSANLLRSQVLEFFDLVKNGEFMVYDSYTGVGYQKVRYAGYAEESFKAKKNWARAIFNITFKVNDPLARAIYSNGKIVAI